MARILHNMVREEGDAWAVFGAVDAKAPIVIPIRFWILEDEGYGDAADCVIGVINGRYKYDEPGFYIANAYDMLHDIEFIGYAFSQSEIEATHKQWRDEI